MRQRGETIVVNTRRGLAEITGAVRLHALGEPVAGSR